MAPSIPTSFNHTSLIPGNIFTARKNKLLTRCAIYQKSGRQTFSATPFSTSLRLFPHLGIAFDANSKPRNPILSSAKTDVIVEEADSPTVGNISIEASEISADAGKVSSAKTDVIVEEEDSPTVGNIFKEASESSPNTGKQSERTTVKSNSSPNRASSKRSRFARKSEMPPVKNEDLIPGATFTGKVKSIQPFGAFVDFGAFTDGLVHISNLSDAFVKDIGSVVSVGQEVKVRLLDTNMESGRISLTMREDFEASKPEQPKDAPVNNDKSRTPKRSPLTSTQIREEVKKASRFVKGQDLEGIVKKLTRSGAFISLPEGEDGFLPRLEMDDEGLGHIMGGSSLQVGQGVSVRVLRITRGQVTLTTKKESAWELDAKGQGIIHTATNPFALAFRKNKEISKFLEQREEELAKKSFNDDNKAQTSASMVNDTLSETSEKDTPCSASQSISIMIDELETPSETLEATTNMTTIDQASVEPSATEDEFEASSETLEATANSTTTDQPSVEPAATKDELLSKTVMDQCSEEPFASNVLETTAKPDLSQEITNKSFSSKSSEKVHNEHDHNVNDEAQTQRCHSGELSPTQGEEEPSGIDFQENNSTLRMCEQSVVSQNINCVAEDPQTDGEVLMGNKVDADEMQNETHTLPSGVSSTTAPVKQMREETGAGIMDCKQALSATDGDIVKGLEHLRNKGLATADKKASRATAEGRIGSYVHDGRIGVLVEVNCETEFVSRGDIFRELVDDLAMQVAACPQVQYLSTEDVPEEVVNKERDIEMQKEDLLSKPEQIRSKIVDGRIKKRLAEYALLEQPYIKNDKVVVKDWVNHTIATLGENIKMKRFVRYNLGEGLEKKNYDFAAEVAAQTAGKSVPPPAKQQPVSAGADEPVEAPKKAVSAALVKQLREETGAGMMDCKKALSETGGDLEKAQDHLRKRGLWSADKKSSRLAAEGRIGSHTHDSRVGVLIEVNCETDFVGRSERFKELVADLAMQVVACPKVQYVSTEDVPEGMVEEEKRAGELSLLEQPFIKDESVLVRDFVKQTVAALGENIKVRRFVRFALGE
ncbi:unnamed protein product [Cuscuta campestris]|uniref:Elongation factor Ts, mitochondrial n=1 Tax=Cuscuta campestris TaxID=132261 RepID=A0A484KQJ8_9ASTE|nr:unnamed protein product [Cuscuta campestris]